MTIELAFENVKKTYSTNSVKFPHLLEMMYKEEKGCPMRESYGITAVLLVHKLYKEGKLEPMSKEDVGKIITKIMDDL